MSAVRGTSTNPRSALTSRGGAGFTRPFPTLSTVHLSGGAWTKESLNAFAHTGLDTPTRKTLPTGGAPYAET